MMSIKKRKIVMHNLKDLEWFYIGLEYDDYKSALNILDRMNEQEIDMYIRKVRKCTAADLTIEIGQTYDTKYVVAGIVYRYFWYEVISASKMEGIGKIE